MFWLWLIFIALLFALFFCGYELFYCIHKHLSEQNQYSDEQKERNVAHKESYIAPVVEKRHKTYSPRDIIQKLRNMHPKNFEEFIELLFCLSGYNTVYKSQRVKRYGKWYARKDGGIDIICKKGDKKKYIQVKKYTNKETSVAVVREMWGACGDELGPADECIIFTTSLFSEDALFFATQKNISVIHYEKLLEAIQQLSTNKENKEAIINFLERDDLIENSEFLGFIKTCPLCLAPLIKRKGGFYGCMNYYKTNCRYTE